MRVLNLLCHYAIRRADGDRTAPLIDGVPEVRLSEMASKEPIRAMITAAIKF